MYKKLKTKLSITLAAMLLMSLVIALPIAPVNAAPTYASVVNANKYFRSPPASDPDTGYGTQWFNYTLTDPWSMGEHPPPNATNYALGYLTVNVTVTDITNLAGWQVNLTWNPTLLTVFVSTDLSLPADHIFAGLDPIGPGRSIDNTAGWLYWARAIGPDSPSPTFAGSGRVLQVKFKVILEPASLLSCDLHLDTVSSFPTKFVTPAPVTPIPFTPRDGHYNYEKMVPPPPKPFLSVYPSVVEKGLPMGPPITYPELVTPLPAATFTVDIVIDQLANASNLVAIQDILIYYNTTLLRVVPDPVTGKNATEGPFMNQTWESNRANSWAPEGTYFFTTWGGMDDAIVMGVVLWPNSTTGLYDWGKFPDTTGLTREQRTVATITFESIWQEEFPWTDSCPLDIEPIFTNYFVNSTAQYILHDPAVNGEYRITGWIMGRQIDVYTQYPFPYGGQGLGEHSDMFEPQKTIYLYANVSYNADAVQHKIVTYQIIPPVGSTLGNFTRSNVTDSNGNTYITFGIPWPCENPEQDVLGIWTVITKVDIMCTVVNDTMQFKVNYYVMNLTVTPTAASFKKGENACFNITFTTFREQPINVLISLVVYDDLGVPIGSIYQWIEVGGVLRKDWCTTKPYKITLCIPLPKWAFVGTGTVYVNALSGFPWNCGRAWCPEASATFTIVKYT